jgi:hypothetical protein
MVRLIALAIDKYKYDLTTTISQMLIKVPLWVRHYDRRQGYIHKEKQA